LSRFRAFLYFYGKNWKRLFCILGHLRELP